MADNPRARPELIPLRRFGAVDQGAGSGVLLARNGYITGLTINANDGLCMR